MRQSLLRIAIAAVAVVCLANVAAAEDRRPNLLIVMTDDQGYGDLACHGNLQIKTPALDAFFASSVRLTNFHVDPTCAPTRAALLTGRYSSRVGVWHTIAGRSLLRPGELTLANIFAAAGYRTGIFGKWHLGDNYPLRPQDRGFQETFIHGGGGVGQTPDAWGNDYFDDTYLLNGERKQCSGYCTDVWFDAASRFIQAGGEQPFLAYITPNTPHSPYTVDEKYSQPYREAGIPAPRAEFYGMITNFDENFGQLLRQLRESKLEDNTIVIFLTDNGTAAGTLGSGFDGGMRGAKGSEYEGGHRVPCFIRWPDGKLEGGRDVPNLTVHIDLLPTLLELCNVDPPQGVQFDGRSVVPLLREQQEWPARTLFVHSQRVEHPEKWRKSAVMTDRWRLINGSELYDLATDPKQKQNVAEGNPEVVTRLRSEYETWWTDISRSFDEYVRIKLGAPEQNPTTLTCHDWHAPDVLVPWNQSIIERDPPSNGFWAIDVVQAGKYEVVLRSRSAPIEKPLNAKQARLKIGDQEWQLDVAPTDLQASFSIELPAGATMLQTWLEADGKPSRGAYFVDVRRIE